MAGRDEAIRGVCESTDRAAAPTGGLREGLLVATLSALVFIVAVTPAYHGPGLADEFVYLLGAQRFAEDSSLNAIFYDAVAIIDKGFPHQDVHSPGYVMALGLFMRIMGPGYWSAVALNGLAFCLSAWLIWDITRQLGSKPTGLRAAACFAVLPTSAIFSSWVMAEVLLGATLLLAAWIAVRWGHRPSGGLMCGVAFGVAVLVRESALFGLPVIISLVSRSKRSLAAFLLSTVVFLGLVYAPLNRGRAPGGANFWAPGGGGVFGFEAAEAAARGHIGEAMRLALARASANGTAFVSANGDSDKAILILYSLIVAYVWSGLSRLTPRRQKLLVPLSIGLGTIVVVLFTFYVAGQWSGYRYLMLFLPLFLALLPEDCGSGTDWSSRSVLPALILACVLVDVRAFGILDTFKRRSDPSALPMDEIAYVDRYVVRSPTRVVWQNGFAYGLRHYPCEVITTSLPQDEATLRALQKAVWYDYVVVSNWQTLFDGRDRYELINRGDPSPLLKIYRRKR